MTKKRCPVCYSELKRHYYATEWGVMDECEACDSCGYVYEFSYGGYQVKVGDEVWQWHYDTDHDEIERFKREIQAAIKKAAGEIYYA